MAAQNDDDQPSLGDKLPKEQLIQADPTGWYTLLYNSLNSIRWVSEKFDGIRAYWNGKEKMFFANGKQIKVPSFFTKGLPFHPLDGELWYKYLRIAFTSSGVVVDNLKRR